MPRLTPVDPATATGEVKEQLDEVATTVAARVTRPRTRELQFGVDWAPVVGDLDGHLELAQAAEAGGLDLASIRDHPYAPEYVDAMSLIGHLLARTSRLRFFPYVASLPLRPPAMLAKTAASLDLHSGGRFELGLGAGGYWDGIEAYGGGRLTPREAAHALEEAIPLIRALWASTGRVDFRGRVYELHGADAGPAPAHPIGIWVGGQSPRTLRLIGRLADGWAGPSPYYLPYEMWAAAQETIDTAARSAGRDPLEIRRIAPLVGTITDAPGPGWRAMGGDPIRASARQWATILAWLAQELRFDTFVFAPEQPSADQILQFGEEVASRTRELVRDGKVRRAS